MCAGSSNGSSTNEARWLHPSQGPRWAVQWAVQVAVSQLAPSLSGLCHCPCLALLAATHHAPWAEAPPFSSIHSGGGGGREGCSREVQQGRTGRGRSWNKSRSRSRSKEGVMSARVMHRGMGLHKSRSWVMIYSLTTCLTPQPCAHLLWPAPSMSTRLGLQ